MSNSHSPSHAGHTTRSLPTLFSALDSTIELASVVSCLVTYHLLDSHLVPSSYALGAATRPILKRPALDLLYPSTAQFQHTVRSRASSQPRSFHFPTLPLLPRRLATRYSQISTPLYHYAMHHCRSLTRFRTSLAS